MIPARSELEMGLIAGTITAQIDYLQRQRSSKSMRRSKPCARPKVAHARIPKQVEGPVRSGISRTRFMPLANAGAGFLGVVISLF